METAKLLCTARCQNWKPELLATANNSFLNLSLHRATNETWESRGGGGAGVQVLAMEQLHLLALFPALFPMGKVLTPTWVGHELAMQPNSQILNFLPADLKL